MKSLLKSIANGLCLGLTWPAAAVCQFEGWVRPRQEGMFLFWSQALALAPGLLGVYVRRAFYRQTLRGCSADAFIGFGSTFTHRDAAVEQRVYVGNFAMIGSVVLRRRCMIGSRASLLSGGHMHVLDEHGDWSPADPARRQRIEIGENAWLGEASVVMADVGARAMVAAGAVVSAAVPDRVMVAGNPARFVKRLEPSVEAAVPAAVEESESVAK